MMRIGLVVFTYVLAAGCIAEKSANTESASSVPIRDLFEQVRIPKIVVAQDGTVLAFADGCGRLRRSEDGGGTWSSVRKLGNQASGNTIVDPETGDVMVVSPQVERLWRSRDHGKTWKREQIAIEPNAMGHGPPDTVPANATASESGITLQHGDHSGRLLRRWTGPPVRPTVGASPASRPHGASPMRPSACSRVATTRAPAPCAR